MLSLNFSLSIGSGYLLTPLVKNRAWAYCKPTPPVRFTTSSDSGRVITQPLCIYAVYLRIAYAVHIIQSRRARLGHPFQAPAAARSRIQSIRAGSTGLLWLNTQAAAVPALLSSHTRRTLCPSAVPMGSSLKAIQCAFFHCVCARYSLLSAARQSVYPSIHFPFRRIAAPNMGAA